MTNVARFTGVIEPAPDAVRLGHRAVDVGQQREVQQLALGERPHGDASSIEIPTRWAPACEKRVARSRKWTASRVQPPDPAVGKKNRTTGPRKQQLAELLDLPVLVRQLEVGRPRSRR